MVEQVNGTLERILRKITIERPSKWATFLSSAVFAYNIGYHSSTGHSPFKMLYGRQPSLPPILYTLVKDTDNKNPLDYVEKLVNTLIEIQTNAYSNILTKKISAYEKSKDTRKVLPKFQVNNQVMFYHNQGYGRKDKLSTLWHGPMEVIQVIGPDAYTLKDISNGLITNRVHAKFMKRFLF